MLTFRRDAATGALTRVVVRLGQPRDAGLRALDAGARPARARHPPRLAHRLGRSPRAADSIVTLQLDPATGALTPTAGTGGCLRRQASTDCRAARSLDDPRGLAVSPDGLRLFAVSALSDGIAVLGPQLAPNCLAVRAATPANKARSVVLACSDPNGDKIALTIVKKPRHGRLGALVKATGSVLYTPLPGYAGADTFTFRATDGMDVGLDGVATVRVTLPPKAPEGAHPHRPHAPAARVGDPRARGVPGDRDRPVPGRDAPARQGRRPRATGSLAWRAARRGASCSRALGVTGRTRAQVVVTVRDKTRRATISRRTILIVP